MDQYDHKLADPLLPPSTKALLVVSVSQHLMASLLPRRQGPMTTSEINTLIQQCNYMAIQLILDAEKEHPEP